VKLSADALSLLVLAAQQAKRKLPQRPFRSGEPLLSRLSFRNLGAQFNVRLPQGLLRSHSFREIPRDLGEAEELPGLISNGGDDDIRPESRSVLAKPPAFVLESAYACGNLQFAMRLARPDILVRIEDGEVFANDLRSLVALNALRAGVPGGYVALTVKEEE
jgi:hypothetical protein